MGLENMKPDHCGLTRSGGPLKKSTIMKTKILWSLSILCIGLLLVGPQLLIFANPAKTATASIPFDFYVKGKKMPSGDYSFSESDSLRGVLWVKGTANPDVAVTFANTEYPINPIKQAKLVFHKYGEIYFLAELWNPILGEELVMCASRSEKEVQDLGNLHQISSVTRPELVEIALNSLPGHSH
jgi:hypothetical protein